MVGEAERRQSMYAALAINESEFGTVTSLIANSKDSFFSIV